MLDRAYFEERTRLADAAVLDYRQRVSDLELQLTQLLTPPDLYERRVVQAKIGEETRTLRWLEGRQAEITQALWALDKQEVELK